MYFAKFKLRLWGVQVAGAEIVRHREVMDVTLYLITCEICNDAGSNSEYTASDVGTDTVLLSQHVWGTTEENDDEFQGIRFDGRNFNWAVGEYTGLFEMIVGVLTTCHLVLQTQPHVISFYGVTSRIRFMFLLFPQVSQNWRYESEPPLKPSQLTCYRQFGTNWIIVLMFVESQRVHI